MADADAEIRSLLARIAQLADTGDLDEYLTLFTDDAVWAMPDNPAVGMVANEKQGHAEIRAGAEERRASGLQGPGTDSRHVLTTIAVDVESDDRATARSYFMFFGSTSTHTDAAHHGSVRRRARERASAAGSSRTARSRSAEVQGTPAAASGHWVSAPTAFAHDASTWSCPFASVVVTTTVAG